MKLIKLLSFFILLFYSADLKAQLNNAPDEIETENGTLIIQPINHASIVLEWKDKTILIDPVGGGELYKEYGAVDLVFITHIHGDHFDSKTLSDIDTEKATFVVPQSVFDTLDQKYEERVRVLANGESIEEHELSILAVPMYNLPEKDAMHPKGWGNGYVLTVGGKNIYISGDTEDIPEMRGLTGIDVAFVCMNLPYTMDIQQAASAVLEFEPSIVYPYHHRRQDIHQFKELVDVAGKNIDVRLKDWYME